MFKFYLTFLQKHLSSDDSYIKLYFSFFSFLWSYANHFTSTLFFLVLKSWQSRFAAWKRFSQASISKTAESWRKIEEREKRLDILSCLIQPWCHWQTKSGFRMKQFRDKHLSLTMQFTQPSYYNYKCTMITAYNATKSISVLMYNTHKGVISGDSSFECWSLSGWLLIVPPN